MAWDLLFGFAGEVNFGPTFLIGLGAYTAGDPQRATSACRSRSASSPARSRPSSAASCWRCRPCACADRISDWSRWSRCCCCKTSIVIFAGVTGGEIGMTVPDVLSIDADVNYWYRARLPDRLRAICCSACRARRSV